jgi:Phage-integrase repeat unit
VRSLRLKSETEWEHYCHSGKKPDDIPTAPAKVYAKDGWTGMGDWLGTGTVAPRLRQYRSFKKARAFVRSLGLKSQTEWRDYGKSGKKPRDIPVAAHSVYAEAGWAGYGDWLGTGTLQPSLRQYRSFKKARAFVRGLGLKSFTEWRDYCASGKKPDDIPSSPRNKYPKAGWAGYGDWLGTGRRVGGWLPFKKARAFVRGLGLKSVTEWQEYSKSGKKPDNIPKAPQQVYATSGWAGVGDWLGK